MAHRTMNPKRRRVERSVRLMQHAKEELQKGDRLQASEKTWAAFVNAAKAVANQRRWEYIGHSQLNAIIRALVDESGETQLIVESSLAQSLRHNCDYDDLCYYDALPPKSIGIMQQTVEAGLARLREISRRYRTDPEYREYADTLRPPNSRYNLNRRQWEPIAPRRRRQNGRPNGRPPNGQTQSPNP